MEGVGKEPGYERQGEVAKGPAALHKADANDGAPGAADELKGGDHLDRAESQGGGAPEEPRHHPQLDGGGEGAGKTCRDEKENEEADRAVPADLVRENAGEEDANAGASEEDEGGDLGHDLVCAHQVPLLDDRVLELAGVVVPLVTRNQLNVVTFALKKVGSSLSSNNCVSFLCLLASLDGLL